MATCTLATGQTIVFAGDSITDCGRRDANAPLGNGYASILAQKITARHPALDVQYRNMGIGGNTILDLEGRWEDDVILQRPDWLTILIGINDLCARLDDRGGVEPETYRAAYRRLLDRAVPVVKCGIILLDPFFLSRDHSGACGRSKILDMLSPYIEVVHEMQRAYRTRHIATHDLFQEQLRYRHPDTFCGEPVHPNQAGHTVIAEALYDTLTASV